MTLARVKFLPQIKLQLQGFCSTASPLPAPRVISLGVGILLRFAVPNYSAPLWLLIIWPAAPQRWLHCRAGRGIAEKNSGPAPPQRRLHPRAGWHLSSTSQDVKKLFSPSQEISLSRPQSGLCPTGWAGAGEGAGMEGVSHLTWLAGVVPALRGDAPAGGPRCSRVRGPRLVMVSDPGVILNTERAALGG